MTRHPAVIALAAGAVVLLAAFAPPLWHMFTATPGPAPAPSAASAVAGRGDTGLPWQIEPAPDGASSRVMGLRPGRDTLADVRARVGDALQVALVARVGEVGALEAMAEPFSAGFVTGRLVLAFDAPPDALRRWREAAPKSEAMDGGLRRFELPPAVQAEAATVRLAGLSFVPTLKLDEADVRQRFGAPAEVRPLPEGAAMLMYPAQGLAATVKTGQRAVLQYVAPADFARRLAAASAPG